MTDNIKVVLQETILSLGKYPNDKRIEVSKSYDSDSRVKGVSIKCSCGGLVGLSLCGRYTRYAIYCEHTKKVFNFIKSELISDLFKPCTECGCSNVMCWPTKEKYKVHCTTCYCTEADKENL